MNALCLLIKHQLPLFCNLTAAVAFWDQGKGVCRLASDQAGELWLADTHHDRETWWCLFGCLRHFNVQELLSNTVFMSVGAHRHTNGM